MTFLELPNFMSINILKKFLSFLVISHLTFFVITLQARSVRIHPELNALKPLRMSNSLIQRQ